MSYQIQTPPPFPPPPKFLEVEDLPHDPHAPFPNPDRSRDAIEGLDVGEHDGPGLLGQLGQCNNNIFNINLGNENLNNKITGPRSYQYNLNNINKGSKKY